MSTEQLGLLLGIAMELDIPVVALVDAAGAATRRHYVNAVPVHVDLSLHCAALTRLGQDGQAQVERTSVAEDCGMLNLYDAWLKIIAEAFVQQSRFDPLHTAETEQVLQNTILQWLAIAARAESVPMEVEYRGITHRAELESLQFVAAAGPVYQNVVSNLRALYRAGELPALQLSDRAAAMPGLADTLKARVGGEVYLLERGATARGLAQRCREGSSSGALTLARHLPWDQAPVEVQADGTAGSGGQPTHLLFGTHAHLLGDEPLVLGSQPGEGERWLDLQQEIRRRYTMREEQEMFDVLLSGASVEQALEVMRERLEQADNDEIELF